MPKSYRTKKKQNPALRLDPHGGVLLGYSKYSTAERAATVPSAVAVVS